MLLVGSQVGDRFGYGIAAAPLTVLGRCDVDGLSEMLELDESRVAGQS